MCIFIHDIIHIWRKKDMAKELEKNYNPAEIEPRLYEKWVANKYFHAEVDRSKNRSPS